MLRSSGYKTREMRRVVVKVKEIDGIVLLKNSAAYFTSKLFDLNPHYFLLRSPTANKNVERLLYANFSIFLDNTDRHINSNWKFSMKMLATLSKHSIA